MERRTIWGCLVGLTAFSAAGAQEAAMDFRTLIQNDARAGNFVALRDNVSGLCGQHVADSKSSGRTIDERLISAQEAEICLRSGQAIITASANDPRANQLLQSEIEAAVNEKEKVQSASDFMGLTWGLGFGYSFSEDEAIDEAVIVDGRVRVGSRKRDLPRVVLEFHKYFWCNNDRKLLDRGCGPFMAVAATADKALSGVGVGWMYGRKSKESDSDGFSVGIGVVLDGDIKDLAEGFEENEPPPGTETTVRFEEKSRWSALLIVTRTF